MSENQEAYTTERESLQALVARHTAERGYREGWTAEQFAARQPCKIAEELAEAAELVRWPSASRPQQALAAALAQAGAIARLAFDASGEWAGTWEGVTISEEGREAFIQELADIVIPAFNAADALGVDLEQVIRAKVRSDVERGVRGE